MKILLAIKPEFAEKIFNGTKRFEFRKRIFKNKNVRIVVVYASSPRKEVVGEFTIEKVYSEKITDLWNLTSEHSGITKEYFYSYFNGKEVGYAIKILSAKKYKQPLNLNSDLKIATAPQSFMYLS